MIPLPPTSLATIYPLTFFFFFPLPILLYIFTPSIVFTFFLLRYTVAQVYGRASFHFEFCYHGIHTKLIFSSCGRLPLSLLVLSPRRFGLTEQI